MHPSTLPVGGDIQTTAARNSPEALRLPESDLEFSQDNNYQNNLQLTARDNQQLQHQPRDNQQLQQSPENQQLQHQPRVNQQLQLQPRDNQLLLLQSRDNKQLPTAYDEGGDDILISQYMNKHSFSINSGMNSTPKQLMLSL